MHSGLVGITLANNASQEAGPFSCLRPNDKLKEAELSLYKKAQEVFSTFCTLFTQKLPKGQSTELISPEDLSDLPKKCTQVFNAVHSIVRREYLSQGYTNKMFPLPSDIYAIPSSFLNDLKDFSTKFTADYPDYFKFYEEGMSLLEPKYQAYLVIGNIEDFAKILNDSFDDTKILRRVALEKISRLKLMAYKENEEQLLPEIDPQEVPKSRRMLFEMFKFCTDHEVKKTSLIELNDLIETDALTSESLGEIVTLLRNMEEYLKDNIEDIQGKLNHIVIETYAKILSLILLYSPKKIEKDKKTDKRDDTIILDEKTKLTIKARLDDLSKLKISGDREAEYWRQYARNCIDLLNTTESEDEKWLEVAGAFALSAVQVAVTAKFSPGSLVDVLDQSYNRIKKALQDNLPTMPYWLPPVVMINRYCQKTMNNPAEFKKIVPTLRKFKHISIQEVRYGIIVVLERIALKTRFVSIEIDAMKLLLQYINIHDETLSYRLVKAFGRILNYRQKKELSNTAYLLMTIIDETKTLFGDNNIEKLHKKLENDRKCHPFTDKTQFHPYLIKYFLKEHGFIDDFGGRPTGFLTVSSLHSNIFNFQTNPALLKRVDQVVKITDLDVDGNTLYHAAVWNKNFEMIPIIRQSGLRIDITAQEYEEGNTALHVAVNLGCDEAAEALLEIESKELLKIKNREGNTPLHLAALADNSLLLLLLKYQPLSCLVNKAGQTPISIAIDRDIPNNAAILMIEILKKNLNYDANAALEQAIKLQEQRETYQTLKRLLLTVKTIDYTVALKLILMMADERGHLRCCTDFAAFHAKNLDENPDYRENFKPFASYPQPRLVNGKTPAKGDLLPGSWPIRQTRSIIDHIKNLQSGQMQILNFETPEIVMEINCSDEFGNTPLFYAAYYADMHAYIPKIVQCGGKVDHLNYLGLAPLHIAVIRGNVEAVKQLLSFGADVNQESGPHTKFTPLHFAAYQLNTEIVSLLLAHHADPNKQSHYGDTALHMACLFRLEKNLRVPDTSLVKNYDTTPNVSPLVKPRSLAELRIALSAYQIPQIDEKLFDEKQLERVYKLLLSIRLMKDSILTLDSEHKNDLNQILDTMSGDFKITLPDLESFEKRVRLIYISITFMKFPLTDISIKDYFGNTILHLAAMHCCPTIPKVICYYQPDLYWIDNYDQLLPIECAQNDPERVFSMFNALNINYVCLDWNGQNQKVEKNDYVRKMAEEFDRRTALRLPLRHILAKANLSDLFERLLRLDPERATRQDLSIFKQTSLHVAARYGHCAILKICINIEKEGKASYLKQRDHFNNTAGHIAIIKSNTSFAKEFALHGGEVIKAKNDDGRTMLHLAAIRGNVEMAEVLIQLGANPFEPDAHGDIPLHLACFHCHPNLVAFFLAKFPKSIEYFDEEGRGALHHACMIFFHAGQAKMMLGLSKADCEDRERDSLAVIRILRERVDLDIGDSSGTTPLMIAAANGYDESVSLLLGNDIDNRRLADVLAQDINQRNALHFATMGKHVQVIGLLLTHDKTFNQFKSPPIYTATDINNETPLLAMTKKLTPKDDGSGVVEIFTLYAIKGADFMEADENGSTLLHWACYNGVTSLVRYLLAKGREKKSLLRHLLRKNNHGNTPMHHAAEKGHLDCIKLLIEDGADANPQNLEGVTPLMLSVKADPPKRDGEPEVEKDTSLADYLLTRRFDLTTCDNQERNFLHYFLQKKKELNDSEKKLLTAAILRNPKLIRKRDLADRNTPLHIAGKYGNADALREVLKSYPFRDILVIMGKKNNHDRDGKQEFEEGRWTVLQPGQQNFKDIWLSVKAEEMNRRPRGMHEIISRSTIHPKYKHRLRKVIPRGDHAMDIAVPTEERSSWSCFNFFRFRRLRVVVPDSDSVED